MLIIFVIVINTESQISVNPTLFSNQIKLKENTSFNLSYKKTDNPTFALGVLIALIVVNPIIELEDKKFYFGLTRELTLVFGKPGSLRLSFEYSYIFKNENRSQFRLSAKYDILSKLHRGEWLSDRTFYSFGFGYYKDKTGEGIFPELAAGFRLGEGDFILQPYAKLRHTFMITKYKPGITDFSVGAILGSRLF